MSTRNEINDYWENRWTNGQTGWILCGPNPFVVKYFQNITNGVDMTGKRVLVPMCGKSPDLKWLCDQGLTVVGVEFAEKPILEFFTENGLPYTVTQHDDHKIYKCTDQPLSIYQGDFFLANVNKLGGMFDFCFDINSLTAMVPSEQDLYVNHLKVLLKKGCCIGLNCYEYKPELRGGNPPHNIGFPLLKDLYGEEFIIKELCRYQEDVDVFPPGCSLRIGAEAVHVYYSLENNNC